MESSKAAWVYPVLALMALIATIWVGVAQCKSSESETVFNDSAIIDSISVDGSPETMSAH